MVTQSNAFKHINGYNKGMNKDLSPRLYDNQHYADAEWMSPMSNEEGIVGPMSNPKGNIDKIQLPAYHTLRASKKLRDKLIIISTVPYPMAPSRVDTYIFEFTDDGTLNPQTPDMSGLGDVTTGNFRLLYSDAPTYHTPDLAISEHLIQYVDLVDIDIDIVTRYESEDIQKVYIADGIHPLRYFNIVYNADTNDYTQYSQKDFNIVPNVELPKIVFSSYILGNVDAGTVFYTYQLYRTNGVETAFSAISDPIVFSSTVNVADTTKLYGSDLETNTGMGVELTVSSLDSTYNRIRCLAIHYSEYDAEPTVRIFFEGAYSSSSITVTDNGVSLGTYDLAEFRVFNQYYIIPKFLTTKNNILFAGKITEKYFDLDEYLVDSGQTALLTTDAGGTGKQFWDSRSYRFSAEVVNTAYLESGSEVPITLSGVTTPDYDSVPYNWDCRNDYNTTASNGYWYNNPTAARKYNIERGLGSSGKNVDVMFSTVNSSIIDESLNYHTIQIPLTALSLGRQKGLQADEIYRFAIQFRDNKGRESFPKWVIDARVPDFIDCGITRFDRIGAVTVGHHIYATFKVENIPVNDDGTAMEWRMLRVPRVDMDKTVLGTAIVVGLLKYAHVTDLYGSGRVMDAWDYQRGIYTRYSNSTDTDVDKSYVQIYSPEVFFSNLNLDGCYLNHQGFTYSEQYPSGRYRKGSADWATVPNTLNADAAQLLTKYDKFVRATTASYYPGVGASSSRLVNIKKWKQIKAQPVENYDGTSSRYTIGDKSYVNVNYVDNNELSVGENGSCVVAQLESRNTLAYFGYSGLNSAAKNYLLYCLIKKDGYPYGGPSYNARLNNSYVPCSDYVTTEGSYVVAYKGDIVLSYFDFLRSQYASDSDWMQQIMYFPVYSQTNLNLRNDDSFSRVSNMTRNSTYKLTEEGFVDLNLGIEITELYRYNPAYSVDNSPTSYTSQPFDSNTVNSHDCRIRRSEVKYNNEYSDSWLKFKLNNYIDVDSQYGALTKLDVYKDKLLFWQPNAFGTVPVGEKELIPSNTSSTLALGSSGILDRYDYLDTFAGVSDKHSVLITPNNILMYSIIRNTMYKFTGGLEPISDVQGMNSWFDQYVTASSRIRSGYNPLMYEAWWTFGNYTVVYSELNNSFIYRLPTSGNIVIPLDYITFNNYFYSTTDNNLIYKHGLGNYGELYGQYLTSSVTILVNPRGTIMNVYDVVEMLTEKYASNGTEIQETFDSIRIYNDYQDTDTLILTPDDNIKRRLRTWRFNKIRDNYADDPKIRGSYVKIELKFLNNANKQLLLHNLTTNYKLSKMMG